VLRGHSGPGLSTFNVAKRLRQSFNPGRSGPGLSTYTALRTLAPEFQSVPLGPRALNGAALPSLAGACVSIRAARAQGSQQTVPLAGLVIIVSIRAARAQGSQLHGLEGLHRPVSIRAARAQGSQPHANDLHVVGGCFNPGRSGPGLSTWTRWAPAEMKVSIRAARAQGSQPTPLEGVVKIDG